MNDFKPKIIIFRCDYCAPPGAESMLASKLKDNFRPTLIKTTCSGRIDPTFILDAFAKGADGVMVVGDRPGFCHFVRGNYKAMRNVKLLKSMLPQLGIEPDRLKGEWVTSDAPKFLASLNGFVDKVIQLGPLKAN
jgi:F420-non-reducing hydrogenase iron-sulfur subunit